MLVTQATADQTLARPYPVELERVVTLQNGAQFQLRPIRPEDELALIEMAEQCTPNDIRLRFFHPVKIFSHDLVSRVCQIDYDHEMALIATELGAPYGAGPIYGIVRLVSEPAGDRAEFAILVRSDMKGHGLGYCLLSEILAYSRRRGIRQVYGEIMQENTTMLQMAHELGFHGGPIERGFDAAHVSIDLS